MGCIDPPDLTQNNLELQPHGVVISINESIEYRCKANHWLATDRTLNHIEMKCIDGNEFVPVTDEIGFCISGEKTTS